jgi:Tfp pilus assembly protein PilF
MKFYNAVRCLTVIVLVFAFAGAADIYGQAGRGRGRMSGVVLGDDDKPVAGADVQIVWHQDQRVKRNTKTNKKGRFAFTGIAGGNWQVFVTAKGYKEHSHWVPMQQIDNNPLVTVRLERPAPEVTAKQKLSSDATLVDKGKQLFAEGKYDEAQEAFEKFLAKQPGFYQTYLLIGNCHKEKGEYEQALAKYKKALEMAPTDGSDKKVIAQTQAAIGDLYVRKNDLKTAQEYFKKSLDLDPNDEILAYNVGEIFFSNGKTDEAIHYFKLAASVKPEWAEPHLKIGYAFLNAAKYKEAVASFEKFLELAPDHDEAPTVKEVIKSLKEM